MSSKWKTLKRTTVFATRWITIFQDTIQTLNGRVIDDYYVAQKPDVAMIAAFNQRDELALIREYKHGCDEFVWQLPAGGIEPGSNPEDVARRELLEETGMCAKTINFLGSWYVSPPFLTNKILGFVSTDAVKTNSQKLEETEEIELNFVNFETALNMVLQNDIKDSASCTIILHLARSRSTSENHQDIER